MKKIVGFFKGIIIAIWVLVAIVTTMLLISINDYGVSEVGDNSVLIIKDQDSEPDYKYGDLVIVKKTSESKYKTGEKAFFYLKNSKYPVNLAEISKIVTAENAEDTYYFGKDTAVSYSDMIGLSNSSKVYHKLGSVLRVFEHRWGFMFLVILPTIFAIVYEIYSIIEEARNDEE